MEGAVRIFAGEYSVSTLSVRDDDPGNPPWVVTPGGAWCRTMFLSGALTEVREYGDMVHTRMADPTGAFDLVMGGRNTPLAETFCKIPVPSFVRLPFISVLTHPTMAGVMASFATVGDLIIAEPGAMIGFAGARVIKDTTQAELPPGFQTAEFLLDHAAIRHYSITGARLQELAMMVEDAVETVCSPECEKSAHPDIRTQVTELMTAGIGPKGIAIDEIIRVATERGASREAVLAAIESLIVDDECYQPQKGFVKLL